MTEFLELPQGLAVAEHLGFHVRDAGLLASALARPSAGMFGVDAYEALELKAAALFSSLAQNHPLFDGNKRFSWIMMLTFLELNGVVIDMPDDDAFELVLAVAQGALELDVIAAHLMKHARAVED